jgi:nitroimidazol reductase NimA-like FMN-containing flavoprotein (pyridoxamine 5'-phosphate oxidase superfamily)
MQMSTSECWELLHATEVGRIAVLDGSIPDIFPVNYRVHQGDIVIRTEAGTKLAAATLMTAVAFEIDEIDPATRTGWSVVVKGSGREPEQLEEQLALDDLDLEPWADAPKSRWLIVTPTEVSGRRIV